MKTYPLITLLNGNHKQQAVVEVRFDYNRDVIDRLKSTTRARWSTTKKCWYILRSDFRLNDLFVAFKELAYIDHSGLNKKVIQPETIQKPVKKIQRKKPVKLPEGYLEILEQKRRSPNTIKIYTSYFSDFIRHFEGAELKLITHDEINAYILGLINEKNISPSQQNQRINCIKFYYEQVIGGDKQYFNLIRAAKERKLPNVLSKKEIGSMIKATDNIKHKALIALIYSCGLRRSEAIKMLPKDIDPERMLVKVVGAKGKKERYVQLAQGTLNQ